MAENHKLAALRNMLWHMEVEVGLEYLTQPQKDVYYAACLVADEDKCLRSEDVKQHPLLSYMSRPTFYRALKELVERRFLVAIGTKKNGSYKIQR